MTPASALATPGPPGSRPASTEHPAPERNRTLALSLGALGVVFGDLGTNPLFAFRECLHGEHGVEPTPANVMGVLSLGLWSLVVVVSIKYVVLVMRADNQGEGGILALMSLIRPAPRRPGARRHVIVLLGLFGAALIYGDGMITPAISVLSAVEGLSIATRVFDPYLLPITIAILVGLFAVQKRGTERMGRVFGPVMLVWFATIAGLGALGLARAPRALAAVDPRYGVRFLMTHGLQGLVLLGFVVLVVTGAEALYADIGHFGKRPIRLAWFVVVFPCLVLCYFGQGALLLARPEAAANPLFELAPRWALYLLVFLATLATIIASQAIITAAFSLTRQAVQLGYLPHLDVRHTSEEEIGQIYVPAANWALLAASLALVVAFKTSSNLAAAYGAAVTFTMAITTLLSFVVMRRLWGWGLARAGAVCGLLLCVDLAFLLGNLAKIREGGWIPLAVGLTGCALMATWKRGRELVDERLFAASPPLEELLASLSSTPVQRVPGTAVFLTSHPERVPSSLRANLRHNHVLHEQVVVLTIVTEDVPRVPASRRLELTSLGHGIHRLVAHYGFMQSPSAPAILLAARALGLRIELGEVTYFLGRETLVATGAGLPVWRARLFALIARNAAGQVRAFHIPPDQVIDLGVQLEF